MDEYEYVDRKLTEISRSLLEAVKLLNAFREALIRHGKRSVIADILLEVVNLVTEYISRSNREIIDISEYLRRKRNQAK